MVGFKLMYPLNLAFKNVISRKSSIVIIVFIAFAISILVVSNSIFDGTDTGLETTFIDSFTGDIVIRPKSGTPLSLFGDETPVTGSLSEIPPLVPYEPIMNELNNIKGLKTKIPQLSYAAAINIDNFKYTTALFGINAEDYFEAMTGLTVTKGKPFSSGEKGIMLNENTARVITSNTGKELHVGDKIQLISSTGSSFTIRSVPLSGIYRYEVENSTLERISLVDPVTLRDLIGVSDVSSDESSIEENDKDLMISGFDIDDLFGDSEDTISEESTGVDINDFKYDADSAALAQETNSSVWNFIICKTDGTVSSKKIIKKINHILRKNNYEAQAVNWRTAAGSTVTMIYFIRVIFNIGIILILATGFIVVNNTLIISALDRIKETGTLRAIGAGRFFVAEQFFAETFILTMTAGIIGCIFGVFFNGILNSIGLKITNSYLMQLFGSSTLTTIVTAGNLEKCMLLSLALSIVGSIYPIHVALSSNPVTAMRGVS